ncbi:MAG: TlpA disulfide reductase family protein [Bacteroidota bacterium]
MMRYFVLAFFLLSVLSVFGQEVQIGEKVPAFKVDLVDEEAAVFSFDGSSGKAVLIDFWASWCSPCIAGMPHLEALKKKFDGKLDVITASEEKYDRIRRFQEAKPYEFLFARDTGSLRALFPYQVIPHSVLIAPDGRLMAITSPEHITEEVIEEVLAGEEISLPVKKDNFDFDPTHEYFDFEEDVQELFQLQPHMRGIPAFSRRYPKGIFKDRRITIFNLNVAGLYRKAYQISSYRLIYEFDESLIDWEDTNNRFCLNVISKSPEDLYPFLQEQLKQHTEVLAEPSTREMEVLIIEQAEGGIKAKRVEEKGYTEARGDGFKNEGASIGDFCAYLEGFGIVGMAVVDESGEEGLFEIDFSFDPENSQSFKDALANLGLTYKKGVRETEVLVLSMKEER